MFKNEKQLIAHLRKKDRYAYVSIFPDGIRYTWCEQIYGKNKDFEAFIKRPIQIYLRRKRKIQENPADYLTSISVPLDLVVLCGPVKGIEIEIDTMTPAEETAEETGIHTMTVIFPKDLWLSWTVKKNRSCRTGFETIDNPYHFKAMSEIEHYSKDAIIIIEGEDKI